MAAGHRDSLSGADLAADALIQLAISGRMRKKESLEPVARLSRRALFVPSCQATEQRFDCSGVSLAWHPLTLPFVDKAGRIGYYLGHAFFGAIKRMGCSCPLDTHRTQTGYKTVQLRSLCCF